MQTWEYKLIESSDFKGSGFLGYPDRADLERALNKLGSEGWEVVNMDFAEPNMSVNSWRALLKRPTR